MQNSSSKAWKGAAAGALGGLAASWAMNLAMTAVARFSTRGQGKAQQARATRRWIERGDPTGEACDSVALKFLGHRLTARQRAIARPVTHYAFGTAGGAVYGALAEFRPSVAGTCGLRFSMGLWIFGEEIGNAVFGLTRPPNRMSWRSHAAMFASHIVYGLTLEATRRTIRAR